MSYKNKYLKYKNKYLKLKYALGGDINSDDVLNFIESIGYEFECADILPSVFIGEEKKNLTKLGYIQLEPFQFEQTNIYPLLISDSLPSGIFRNIDQTINNINKIMNMNSNINIFLRHGDLIKDINNYKSTKGENFIFIKHVEYIFTFETINNSRNIIFETLKSCIDYLINHYTQFIKKESEFNIYDKSTSALLAKIPIDSYENEIEYTYNNNDSYKNREASNDISSNLIYLLQKDNTFAQTQWVPQLTVGVKLKNIHKVLLYLSRSNDYLYKLLKEAKKETNILKENFLLL
jgi:hypothetical protein